MYIDTNIVESEINHTMITLITKPTNT